MSWYLQAMKKYADFGGRARRKEYWMFFLVNIIISIALFAIEVAAGGVGILAALYNVVIIIPQFAVATRRLHDTDRSGWYNLIWLVPLPLNLVLLYFMCEQRPGRESIWRESQGVNTLACPLKRHQPPVRIWGRVYARQPRQPQPSSVCPWPRYWGTLTQFNQRLLREMP